MSKAKEFWDNDVQKILIEKSEYLQQQGQIEILRSWHEKEMLENQQLRASLDVAIELARNIILMERSRGYPTSREWAALVDMTKEHLTRLTKKREP